MSDKEIADQVKRLLIKATMLRMGEPIAFGSDSYALECAADTIEQLMQERGEARKWERLHEVELNSTVLVLGHRFTLALPDGGDVRPCEAAKSAIDALAVAEARVAELEASLDEDRLTDIITESIDLDWTPRTAAKAIVRAMGGGSDGQPS